MKVSVSITTYNHGPYIAQAIESVLMQDVNFPYEILIGEDQSSDETRDIVLAYHQKYPELIRLFLHEHPPGFRHVNGRQNFVNNIVNATGQYIALLEGDDYWTCRSKLQKQVDFLDAHPEFAMCFHNAKEVYESGEREPWNFCPAGLKETLTLRDLLVRNYPPTCSVVFRRGLFQEFPDWYLQAPFGDWPLNILNAQHGKSHYIDEVMGVHRNHAGCVWSTRDQISNTQKVIQFYPVLSSYLGPEYRRTIDSAVSRLYYHMAMVYRERGDYVHTKESIIKGIRNKPFDRQLIWRRIWWILAEAIVRSRTA